MGTTSTRETRALIRRLAYRIKKFCSFEVEYSGFVVNNIAGTVNANHEIDLELLAQNSVQVRFNPETFAGAVFTRDDGVKLTIFRNGKINATGFTSFRDLKNTVSAILDLVDIYKVGSDSAALIREITEFVTENNAYHV